MRRDKAFKGGAKVPIRLASLFLVGGVGYLVGSSQFAALSGTDVSAAEAVALRFPQNWDNVAPASAAAIAATATANTGSDAQFALLSPEPMIPQAVPQIVPQVIPQAVPQAAAPAPVAAGPPPSPIVAPEQPQAQSQPRPSAASEAKAAAAAAAAVARRRADSRPGYMLNDTQIASIKQRLHLTPDQEQMWPAVEAALRNVAYARARAVPVSTVQAAAVDPNSVEVQGLKSAAVPLIMSFNDEQKEEVRNLAHVMGLDQLASQF